MTHDQLTAFSDTALQRQLDGFEGPGPQNAAPYLLELPTPELRAKAYSRARLLQNLVPGYNHSGAVQAAVRETQQIGLAESPDERYNREMLQREHVQKCPAWKPGTCSSPMHVDADQR